MEYTKNYKLPQWVESDRIMMEDFNQMCADIDTGLAEVKKTADAAGTTASEGSGKISSLETRMTAVEQDIKFVRLGIIQASSAGSYNLELSGVDLSGFSNMLLDCVLSGSYTGASLFINGDTSGKYQYGSDTTSTGGIWLSSESGGDGHTMAYLHPFGSQISCSCQRDVLNSYGASCETETMGYSGCNWTGIKSLLLKTTGGGVATITVYGIKA